MRQEPPKKPDPLLLLARASAGKRRKRSPVAILLTLAVLVGGLGLAVWLAMPGPDPPPLMVIAFDQVGLPQTPVSLNALLRPQEEEEEPVELEGFDLFFVDSRLGGPGVDRAGELLQEQASTAEDGSAKTTWQWDKGPQPHSFVVRFRGDKRHPGSYDVGRVFTWPAKTNLLIVEARYGLMSVGGRAFRKQNIFELAPHPGAVAALKQVQARKYQIVYLATAPGRPADYRKLRGWLQRRLPGAESLFPEGPALGRADYSEKTSQAESQRGVLQELKRRFRGKLVGLAGRPEDAVVFRDAGLTTLLLGKGEKPVGNVRQVKSWDKVPAKLPKPRMKDE
jgi:hypothetical protein